MLGWTLLALRTVLLFLVRHYIRSPLKRLVFALLGGSALTAVAVAQQIQFAESPYQAGDPATGLGSFGRAFFFTAAHLINTDTGGLTYHAWTTKAWVLILPVIGLLVFGTLVGLYATQVQKANGISGADQ